MLQEAGPKERDPNRWKVLLGLGLAGPLVAGVALVLLTSTSEAASQGIETEQTPVEPSPVGVPRSADSAERYFADQSVTRPMGVPLEFSDAVVESYFDWHIGSLTGNVPRSADEAERFFKPPSHIAVDTSSPGAAPPRSAAIAPISTKFWSTYRSSRYDFKLAHPPHWTEVRASRDWRGETDAGDPRSRAHDAFLAPNGAVRVSVWSVPLDPGIRLGWSFPTIEAWVEDYCKASGNTSCTGIGDRAVALCLERYDCHPGLLVPFRNNVQAFFGGGIYDAKAMTVVAVWRGESAPAVAPYGGSQRLLEAFLSTMKVWPASTPLRERTCRPFKPPCS